MSGVDAAAHELTHDLVLTPQPPLVGPQRWPGHWCKLRGRVAVAGHMLLEMGQGLLAAVLMKKQGHYLQHMVRTIRLISFLEQKLSFNWSLFDAPSKDVVPFVIVQVKKEEERFQSLQTVVGGPRRQVTDCTSLMRK